LPQVTRFGKYIIFFWSRETGEPAHVHVCEGTPQADATKIWMTPMIRLAHNKSKIPVHDLNLIMKWLVANRNIVMEKWLEHFED